MHARIFKKILPEGWRFFEKPEGLVLEGFWQNIVLCIYERN
jgi:hypothetical protein